MKALDTITMNFMTLWNCHKNWTLDGGLIWLTAYLILCCIITIIFSQIEKRLKYRASVYQAATKIAQARISQMKVNGYIERKNR